MPGLDEQMYGQIGAMKPAPGKRAELISRLLAGRQAIPGNLTYIVAGDASLQLESVQRAIAATRTILEGFGLAKQLRPVGFTG